MDSPEIIHIQDIHDPRAALFAGLTEKQLLNRRHPENGIFIAESPHVIELALKAGCEPVSLLCAERHINGKAADIIRLCGVPVLTASDNVLQSLTGYTLTRGILCAMKRPAIQSLEKICAYAHRIAVLHNLTDASNVGAIFRSAAALGVDGIILAGSCCDPLVRKSVRVSMGSVFLIPWCHTNNNVFTLLRDYGFITAAMALTDNSISLESPLLGRADKLAVVLGNEGAGLPENVIADCDHTVLIPMHSGVDSLNVAAAAAVTFWQTRYRKGIE